MSSAVSRSDRARSLRKNMTDAERKLWYRINRKQLGVKFRRQQPIGRYIVDFVCFAHKVIIEVDGGQHDQCFPDMKRDQWFVNQGYRVLRFWNNEVLQNVDGVVARIMGNISPSPSSPPPPEADLRIEGGE